MMLRRVNLFICLMVLAGALAKGYAQNGIVIDKVVAVVGNSIVLYSEVDEVSKQIVDYRRERGYTTDRDPKIEALESLMEQKLLYNQALIDSVEISQADIAEMVEERMSELIAGVGGVAQLEAQIHRPVYEIRREISNRMEERMYAQRMRGQIISKVGVTPGEVDRFYRKMDKDSLPMVPIQYVYGQITKYPTSTREAKLRAREQLLGLRERIAGGARFDMLARMYSDDGSAYKGGELDPMTLEQLEAPFAKALEKLKPDQVSEVVETIYGFHIIQLIGKKGNLYHARHILARPVFTDLEMIATDMILDSLAIEIRRDSVTFEAAVQSYSDDKFSKLNSGLVSNLEQLEMSYGTDASMATTKHYKENLPVADFKALDKLSAGEISNAFQAEDYQGNKMSKVVKLIEIIPSHPANLKEDYLEIEAMAINKKQEITYKEWLENKISSMFIRLDPEFKVASEFENKSWLK